MFQYLMMISLYFLIDTTAFLLNLNFPGEFAFTILKFRLKIIRALK